MERKKIPLFDAQVTGQRSILFSRDRASTRRSKYRILVGWDEIYDGGKLRGACKRL